MSKKREVFNIDESAVEEFIKINTPVWNVSEDGISYKTRKCIYVNLSMVRMQVAWVIPKLIYAKGLAEREGARVIIITWNENPLLEKFFDSYGMDCIALNTLCEEDKGSLFAGLFKTMGIALFSGSGEGLQKSKICGVTAGREIYEDILRTSDLSTIGNIRNKVCLKKTLHIIWVMYALEKFLKKHPPLAVIDDDVAYHEGALEKLFKKNGAKLIVVNNTQLRGIPFDNNGEIIREREQARGIIADRLNEITDETVAWTDKYMADKFKGLNGREIDRVAYAGKKIHSRQEVAGLLGLDEKKKNIVIMAHTFTDAIYNQGSYFFKDYYEWTKETLKIAANVKNVNWILKPHPSRHNYKESKQSIEALFEKYKTDNMFILPDEISGESICSLADVTVTIGSNAAIEYACFGIPSVMIGHPYFYGFGFTKEPANYEEYKRTLEKINDIMPLTDEETRMAKGVFYLYVGNRKVQGFDDEFSIVANAKHKEMHEKMAAKYFGSDEGTKDYNTAGLKDIIEYMKNHDIRETQYYKAGYPAQ